MIPTIFNISMANANQEYGQALPVLTKTVLIQNRNSVAIQLAYIQGQSGTNYITIPAGASKSLDGAWVSSLTLYFQSPSAGQVCEIECWN